MRRPLLARGRGLAALAAGLAARGAAGEAQASNGEHLASPSVPKYYWATKGGNIRQDGASPEVAPRNLSHTRSWSYQADYHKHFGMPVGTPLIDDKMNVYVHDSGGLIRKYTHSGAPLWSYDIRSASPLQHTIWNGTLLGSAAPGIIFALDMETGKELWKKQVAENYGGDGASILGYNGVGLVAAGIPSIPANLQMIAFSIFTGDVLWRYQAEGLLYNSMPTVLEEKQIVVFSDQWGRAYGVNLMDGQEVWKNTEIVGRDTFSTGNGMLGSNGIFYLVCNLVNGHDFVPAIGVLHAVNATDGATVWSRTYPTGLHATPGVGRLRPGSDLSVIVGLGDNTGIVPAAMLPPFVPNTVKRYLNELSIALGDWSRFLWWTRPWTGQKLQVVALDAKTGADQWIFETPTWWRPTCAGDEERVASAWSGIVGRSRGICTCDSWSSPAIGGDGTVYIGNAYGVLYALRDDDRDGVVRGDTEASFVDLGAALIMPPSIAPGMLAVVTCDEVVIYRT